MATTNLSERTLPERTFKTLQDLLRIASQTPDQSRKEWSLFGVKNNTRLFRLKNKGSNNKKGNFVTLKSNVVVRDANPKAVVDLVTSVEKRFEWDCLLQEAKIVQKNKGKGTDIIYLAYQSHTFWAWPRDYEINQYVHYEGNTDSYFVAFHSTDSVASSNPDYVRGNIDWGGFIVQPWKSDGKDPLAASITRASSITFVCCADFGGFLNWCPTDINANFLLRHMQCVNGIALLLGDQFSPTSLNFPLPNPKVSNSPRGKVATFPEKPRTNNRPVTVDLTHEKKPLFDDDSTFSPITFKTSASMDSEPTSEPLETKSNQNSAKDLSALSSSPPKENQVIKQVQSPGEPPLPTASMEEQIKMIPAKYQEITEEKTELLLQLCLEDSDEWKVLAEQKDVKVTRKESSDKTGFVRGSGIINSSAMSIILVMTDIEKRGEWDETLKEGKNLTRYSENSQLSYLSYNAPWPVTGRDFCSFTHIRFFPDGKVAIVAFSVEDNELCPPKKGFVRADLFIGGYLMIPVSPTSTQVIYIQKADLKGNLPTSLVNQVNVKLPLCIDGIRRVVMSKK